MSEIDNKIKELFGVLSAQKAKVEEVETESKRKWVTNCSFPSVFGNTQPINIQTQTEPALVELLSDLLIHVEFNKRAAELIGSNIDTTYWGGYPLVSWVADFKTRIAKIQVAARKQELMQLEKRLDAIVSPEERRAMELEAIVKSLEA